jgi:Na+-driven multidrug efflux pump
MPPWLDVSGIRRESYAWLKLSVPATLRGFSEQLPSTLALVFIGRLGTKELAAVSISDVWMYSTAFIVWNGIGSTQASLVAQAHGAGGLAAARGWAIISFSITALLSVLVGVWWAATDPVLNALSLDSHLDRASVRAYSLWSIPSLIPIALNVAISSQLVAVQLPLAPMVVEFVCCVLDVGAMYLLIFGVPPALRGYGVVGSALGMFVSQVGASFCYAAAAFVLLRGRLHVLPSDAGDAGSVVAAVATGGDASGERSLTTTPHDASGSLNAGDASSQLEGSTRAPSPDIDRPWSEGKSAATEGAWLEAPWSATWAFCAEWRNWKTFMQQAR